MKITIPIEIEITKQKTAYGETIFSGNGGNFLDAHYKETGFGGYSLHWIVENMATRLADALTPSRLTYEITKRLKDGDIDE